MIRLQRFLFDNILFLTSWLKLFPMYMHGIGALDNGTRTGSDRASGNTPLYVAF